MKRFTVTQLSKVCTDLKGKTRAQAYAIARKNGISSHNIDVLRSLLGYSNKRPERHDEAFVKKIVQEVEDGATISAVSKRHGLLYSSVHSWCRKLGVDYNTREFWSERKIQAVCISIMQNKDDRETALKIGCSLVTFRNMKQRLRHKIHCNKWVPVAEKMGLYKCQ